MTENTDSPATHTTTNPDDPKNQPASGTIEDVKNGGADESGEAPPKGGEDLYEGEGDLGEDESAPDE